MGPIFRPCSKFRPTLSSNLHFLEWEPFSIGTTISVQPLNLETEPILNQCSSSDTPLICTNEEQTVKPQQS